MIFLFILALSSANLKLFSGLKFPGNVVGKCDKKQMTDQASVKRGSMVRWSYFAVSERDNIYHFLQKFGVKMLRPASSVVVYCECPDWRPDCIAVSPGARSRRTRLTLSWISMWIVLTGLQLVTPGPHWRHAPSNPTNLDINIIANLPLIKPSVSSIWPAFASSRQFPIIVSIAGVTASARCGHLSVQCGASG